MSCLYFSIKKYGEFNVFSYLNCKNDICFKIKMKRMVEGICINSDRICIVQPKNIEFRSDAHNLSKIVMFEQKNKSKHNENFSLKIFSITGVPKQRS